MYISEKNDQSQRAGLYVLVALATWFCRPKIVLKDMFFSTVPVTCIVSGTDLICSGDGELRQGVVRAAGPYTRYKTATVQDGITSLGDSCFDGCSSLQNVALADTVTSISRFSLSATAIKYISIGRNVDTIGAGAFEACIELRFIEVDPNNPYYYSDDQGILYSIDRTILCAAPATLTTITIPSTVEIIYSYSCAYIQCTTVSMSDYVEQVHGYAFYSSALKSITIGSGLSAWGENAVMNCINLTKITVSPSNPLFYSSNDGECFGARTNGVETSIIFMSPLVGTVVIDSTITTISQTLIQSCSEATALVLLGSSLGSVYNDQLLVKNNRVCACVGGAVSVDMSDLSITEIGVRAFYGLSKLTSVIFPSTLLKIRDSGFMSCTSLTSVDWNGAKVDTMEIRAFAGSPVRIVTLPTSLKIIGERAFAMSCVYNVNLESVEYFYMSAFRACLMTKIQLSNVITIREACFYNCSLLQTVDFSSNTVLTNIDSMAFSCCDSLQELVFPKCLTSLVSFSVAYNQKLVSIQFDGTSNSYESINGAVYSRDRKTIIICPSGVYEIEVLASTEIIGSVAFYGCVNLVNVVMPEDLQRIEESAFVDCAAIRSIRIPGGVQFIGQFAFDSCSRLTEILWCNNRDCPYWEGDPFPTCPNIYVFFDYMPTDMFCGHTCYKFLDHECNIPTNYFSDVVYDLYMGGFKADWKVRNFCYRMLILGLDVSIS